MKLKLKSTYIEETNEYPSIDEAIVDAARLAEIESRGTQGIGTATVSDSIGTVSRVVVTSCNRPVQGLIEEESIRRASLSDPSIA